MTGERGIEIARAILEEIDAQARAEAPNEACGYLAGSSGAARLAIRLTNVDASPEHYSMSPKEQFAALKRAREEGLELLAVYHSHPATPARMSAEDIRLANDPRMTYLIYSLVELRIKAFVVDQDKRVREVPVRVAEGAVP